MNWPNVNGKEHSSEITLEDTALDKSNYKVGDRVKYRAQEVEIISYERLLLLADHVWNEGYPQIYIPIKFKNGRITGVNVHGIEGRVA